MRGKAAVAVVEQSKVERQKERTWITKTKGRRKNKCQWQHYTEEQTELEEAEKKSNMKKRKYEEYTNRMKTIEK